jgi:YbbR domain-containing protein
MTRNLFLKAAALIIALIIWIYVSAGDMPVDKLLQVPLALNGPTDDVALVTDLPDKVELYVRGPLSRIRKIEDANDEGVLKAVLDLRHAPKGVKQYRIRITGANLRWLDYRTIPPRLEIQCDSYSEAVVAPERHLISGLEPGSYIELESGLPETVRARGAAPLIDKLDKVVYRLSEEDLVGFGNIKVTFIPWDSEGRKISNVEITPAQADLKVSVRQSGAEREIPVVYNLVGSPPVGFTITELNIDPLLITIQGPPEILKEISRIDTEPIDLTGRSADFTIPTLKLVSPDGRVKLSRSTVILEVKIAHKTTQRKFEGLSPRWNGGEELILEYSSEPLTVDVTVTGPITAIDSLKREDIIPTVNVIGLAEGLYENRPVTVQILTPGISLISVEPAWINVRVKQRAEFDSEGDEE